MSDIQDLEAPEEQTRETASEIPTFYFLGEPLKPFSLGRQLASQRVLSGQVSSDLQTSMCIVYLCTIGKPLYEKTRTPDGLTEFLDEMEAWAESKRIGLKGHPGQEVVKVANEIWAMLDASEFETKLKPEQQSKEPPSPNESGRAPLPATSRRSRRSHKAV